jgi:TonB family protein
MKPTTTSTLLALIALLAATSAVAQPAAPAAASPELTPPQVTKFVSADRPADAGDDAAVVELDLTIAADGTLTNAVVVSSAGEAFDAAALEAVRKFVFAPARRGDKPVPARIRYRYVFDPVAPVQPLAPPPGEQDNAAPVAVTRTLPGRLRGKILVRATGQPVVDVEVSLLSQDGAEIERTLTVEGGEFQFADLAPGRYRVHVDTGDLAPLDQTESVAAGELTTVTYRLDASKAASGSQFGATASIEAPAREVTKRTLQADELTRAAGTRGDPLRAIELLPGVARPPGLMGVIIIRGSSPADSQVVVDGAPVERLYHFGGLTSFTQPRLIERLDLYPGNFSARYGRKMGGIVDVGIRDPKTDGVHGVADINLIDSSLLVEGPVGQRGGFAVAAKRSYIDLWLNQVVPSGSTSITASPVYYDYQAIYTYRPENGDRLRLMAYGSGDIFRLLLANPSDGDPAVSGNVGQATAFHRVQAGWRHSYAPGVEHDISITAGYLSNNLAVGTLGFNFKGFETNGRAEWRAQLTPRLKLMGGLDVHAIELDVHYDGPRAQQQEGDPGSNGPLTDMATGVFDGPFRAFRPAVYLEAMLQPVQRLTVVAGVRGDYFSDVNYGSVDPRLTARLQLAERTVLKGGVGLFSQPPQYGEAVAGVGNPNLRLMHAQHYGLGIEQGFGERASVSVEGFYKYLYDLEVNGLAPDGLPAQVNGGHGRIYGLEMLAKLQPTGRLFGFVSYTLSRSERNDHGDGWRLFDYDQTHILTVAGGYRLGRGWDLSSTFRLVSGNPATPITGGIYNANQDFYSPVYGATNSIRDPLFQQLDVRVEKSWKMKGWQLATYLDVQNALNRRNQEGLQYNYDYSQSQTVSGLPIIPSLGVRGEL